MFHRLSDITFSDTESSRNVAPPPRNFLSKTAALTAGGILFASSILAPQAHALFSDNVHGDYGAADCQNGDDCVEKVGDEAEVSWDIKLANVLNSNDHVQTSKGASIFVPQMVEDIKLEVTHSTDHEEWKKKDGIYQNDVNGNIGVGGTYFPMKEHNPPIEMEDLTGKPFNSDDWGEDFEDGGWFIPKGYVLEELPMEEISPTDNSDSSDSQEDSDSTDTESDSDTDSDVTDIDSQDDSDSISDDSTSKDDEDFPSDDEKNDDSSQDSQAEGSTVEVTKGSASSHPGDKWNQIDLAIPHGITSFRLSGTVTTDSEDTYVPIRVKSGNWRCFNESPGPGSYEDGCQDLGEYDWGRTGMLPPIEFASEEEKVKYYNKNTKEDGLSVPGQRCAVTKDTPVDVGTIGHDIEPAAEYQKYVQTFDLHANPAVTYVGALNGPEDMCDNAVFHVALCNEDSDTPDSPETTRPNRPGITIPNKPGEKTTEPSIPSEEPKTSDSEKPEEYDDEKVTGTTSTKEPDTSDSLDEDVPVDESTAPDRGGFYPGSQPQPVNSTQTAGGSTISNETASEVKGEPEGLEVNTGGKTERRSLKQVIVDWILQK